MQPSAIEKQAVVEAKFNYEILRRCHNAGLRVDTSKMWAIDALIAMARRATAGDDKPEV